MAQGIAEDLNMIGFRTYCPMGKKVVYRGRHGGEARHRRVHQFPVFGRYLFVGELEDPFQTEIHFGVVAVIRDQNGARSVNPEALKQINDAEMAGTWDSSREAEAAFRRGDLVRVVSDLSHPFAGFNAIVDSIRKSGVRINVDIFGRSTPITIPQDKLELV